MRSAICLFSEAHHKFQTWVSYWEQVLSPKKLRLKICPVHLGDTQKCFLHWCCWFQDWTCPWGLLNWLNQVANLGGSICLLPLCLFLPLPEFPKKKEGKWANEKMWSKDVQGSCPILWFSGKLGKAGAGVGTLLSFPPITFCCLRQQAQLAHD